MKRNPLSRLLSVLLCLCLVAGMLPAALAEEIGGSEKTEESGSDTVAVSGIEIKITNGNSTIKVGDSVTIAATVTPEGATDSSVTWSVTGATDAVSQSENGNSITLTGKAAGKVSVIAEAGDKQSTAIEISVEAEEKLSISLNETSIELKKGETTDLTATVEPSGADVTWKSDDPSIAKVDGNGIVTAVGKGKATITATASSGGKTAEARCTVTVTEPINASISLQPTSLSMRVGDTERLAVATIPENQSVTWSSDNKGVASVDSSGKVTANAVGSTKITASITVDGQEYSSTCTVSVSASNMTLNKTSLTLTVNGSSETLSVGNLPAGATVSWSSGNNSIATVSNGTVKGVAAGNTTITAKVTYNGTTTDLKCTVTVNPSGVPTISNTSLTLNVNKSSNLTISNLPTGATVTWSTANSSIAKLSTTTGTSITVTGVTVGGPVRVTATVKNGSAVTPTLFCDVTVTAGSPAAINKTVKADGTLTLNASDFNSVCTGVYGASLSHVRFSSNSVSAGTLYYGYTQKDGGAKIDTGRDYSASNSGSRRISDITFVPSGRGGETATFSYTATDVNGKTYAGQLIITIESPSGNVKYETAKDEPVDFDSGDFDDICRSITGSRLDYVTFTLPSSSRGTLYYDYGGKDEEKLSSSDKCYADEDDGDFGLDGITFVPKSGYTGTVTFNYSGRSTSKDSFSGTVTITISKTGSTLRYEIDENEELELDDSDFNDYCKDQTGSNLDYVTFDLPSSSRGTLYYKYGKSGEDDISSSDKFYRSSSPRLDDVTFVPKSGYTGTLSIDFSGRSVDGDRFTGTVKIEVGGNGGDISYSAASGSPVRFNLSDFNDLCQDETDERLDYVTFTLPSSSRGTLYYKYGQSGEDKISSSDKFYRSGTPSLADVSFVPASGFTGTLEIDFSGRSTDNDRFSGTVSITYTAVKDPSVIRYSSNGGAVTFRSSDFVSACAARDAGSLVSVMFNTPASGTLYYGYNSPTSYGGVVAPRVSFGTGSGSSSISGVTYVPKAGYSGTEVLTYTGTDNKGATFTGTVSITVTPVTTSQFTDMGNYSWAAASVDFLYKNGITTGTSDTTYGPAGNITRGDFVLMLARAFQLSGGDVSNSFSDVPANSYYAQAIASAKALGIAQGGGSTFNPTGALTRQDAMVLLHRTLSRTGRTIPDASSTYLSRFTDGSNVSNYAQGSVAALVQAGVIQGDTSGRLNPQGSLTRAEMAVILHRVLTL